MHLTLFVWRQAAPDTPGAMRRYEADDVSPDMSFLEMLDVVNEALTAKGEQPIAFDHDCREGICGSCGMMINGVAHGPMKGTATCQLHMRSFDDGATIYIEPWRARAFPVIKDLVVNRGAFDRIIAAGGFITAPTGGAQDANDTLVAKHDADSRWTPRPASGAAPASRRAQMRRPPCSRRRKSRILGFSRKANRSDSGARSAWWHRWTPKASGTARSMANVWTRARRRSASTRSRG